MCSQAPDTSRQDATADKIATLSSDQWDWVKQQYADQAPARAAAEARANTASDIQTTQAWKAMALGDESAADYRRIYRPLEEQAADEARNYDSDEHASQLAGRAQADVQQAAAMAQGAAHRNLASMGVNPADGAYANMTEDAQRGTALAMAGARTKARSDAETVGRALRSDVIGTGRGVVGSQGTQAGLAVNSAGASANTGAMPVTVAQGGTSMVSQGAQQAVSGLQSSANIYGDSARLQASVQGSNSQGLGALAGAAGQMAGAAIF